MGLMPTKDIALISASDAKPVSEGLRPFTTVRSAKLKTLLWQQAAAISMAWRTLTDFQRLSGTSWHAGMPQLTAIAI